MPSVIMLTVIYADHCTQPIMLSVIMMSIAKAESHNGTPQFLKSHLYHMAPQKRYTNFYTTISQH